MWLVAAWPVGASSLSTRDWLPGVTLACKNARPEFTAPAGQLAASEL